MFFSIGVETAYLSTIDKQAFYSKLGYSECEKISFYGGWINSVPVANSGQSFQYLSMPVISPKREIHLECPVAPIPSFLQQSARSDKINTSMPSPPPPPPLHLSHAVTSDIKTTFKTYMKKDLIREMNNTGV